VGRLDVLDGPIRVAGAVEEVTGRSGDLLGASKHVLGRSVRIGRFAKRMHDESRDGKPPGTAKFLWRLGGLFFGDGT
jgi:hypothetical protein